MPFGFHHCTITTETGETFNNVARDAKQARTLALDAYRFVSREYADIIRQCRRMEKRHGQSWANATYTASLINFRHKDTECAAKIIDMIEKDLSK